MRITLHAVAITSLTVMLCGACESMVDCSLNGECVVGRCRCRAPWKGEACDQFDVLPVDLTRGYDSPHGRGGGKTSSWGGSVVKVGGRYHMYAAEMENYCGIAYWEPNSRVVHASSIDPSGPYQFEGVVAVPFAHEPNAVLSPTGEVVIYFTMRHPDGFEMANCTYPLPPPPPPGPPPPCTPPPPRHSYMVHSTSPYGPWSDPVLVLKANESKWGDCPVLVDTNLAMAIRPNGSAIGIWRKCVNTNNPRCATDCCTFPHLITASDWRDPTTYNPHQTPMFPDMLPYGAEDPFVWFDARHQGGIHAILHDEQGATRSNPNGTHAFSPDDGATWYYGKHRCYQGNVTSLNGEQIVYSRRERPHLILDDKSDPIYVTNGVQEEGQDNNCSVNPQCYRSYTLVQPLRRRV